MGRVLAPVVGLVIGGGSIDAKLLLIGISPGLCLMKVLLNLESNLL